MPAALPDGVEALRLNDDECAGAALPSQQQQLDARDDGARKSASLDADASNAADDAASAASVKRSASPVREGAEGSSPAHSAAVAAAAAHAVAAAESSVVIAAPSQSSASSAVPVAAAQVQPASAQASAAFATVAPAEPRSAESIAAAAAAVVAAAAALATAAVASPDPSAADIVGGYKRGGAANDPVTGVYDEVELEDMEWNEENEEYSYPCPCGDKFRITKSDLLDGEDIARCASCSLLLKVIYDPEDLEDED